MGKLLSKTKSEKKYLVEPNIANNNNVQNS